MIDNEERIEVVKNIIVKFRKLMEKSVGMLKKNGGGKIVLKRS